MNTIRIQALDTLFFRDGRPFSMGDETTVETKLIPFPTVFWGAIFTHLLVDGKVTVKDKAKLKIGRVFLFNPDNQSLLLPIPSDIFINKDGKVYTEKYEDIGEDTFLSKNIHTEKVVVPDTDESVKRADGYFIDVNSFKPYLNKFDNDISIYGLDKILDFEFKVGIKRSNSTNITEDGNLYRLPMLRFLKNWQYAVEYEIDGLDLPNQGILKLGGEGKSVLFQKTKEFKLNICEESCVQSNHFFKIYASSPLIFKDNHWVAKISEALPNFKIYASSSLIFKDNHWVAKISEALPNCELFTLSNSNPISVGGWDMDKKEPKKMAKALPAGTVFMIQNKGNVLTFDLIRTGFKILLNETETPFGFNQFEILV